MRVYGQGLRRLLAVQGLQVTVVTPGFIATPMSASLPMPMPFLWTVERAAKRITEGIARNEAEIIFPWQFNAVSGAFALLPASAVDIVLTRASKWFETP